MKYNLSNVMRFAALVVLILSVATAIVLVNSAETEKITFGLFTYESKSEVTSAIAKGWLVMSFGTLISALLIAVDLIRNSNKS